jgi:hypothetical protein
MLLCIINVNNVKYMIDNTTKYLKEILDANAVLSLPGNYELSNLPNYLRDVYEYRKVNLFNREIYFIFRKNAEPLTAYQYKKQINLIQEKLSLPVALVLDTIEPYNRKRLIEQKINFVIPGKQIFLPFMFVDLNDYSNAKKKYKDILTPAAQVLLLYHLQCESLNGKGIKDIALKLNYSEMTISRAVKDLIDKNLSEISAKKDFKLLLDENKLNLWNKILQYLKSPVVKTVYLDLIPAGIIKYKANVTALSHYTDIAGDYIERYAAAKNNYDSFFKKKNNEFKINDYEGNSCIEIWRYDPGRIAKNNECVDKLSLYLSMMDNEDERIQKELHNLISGVIW